MPDFFLCHKLSIKQFRWINLSVTQCEHCLQNHKSCFAEARDGRFWMHVQLQMWFIFFLSFFLLCLKNTWHTKAYWFCLLSLNYVILQKEKMMLAEWDLEVYLHSPMVTSEWKSWWNKILYIFNGHKTFLHFHKNQRWKTKQFYLFFSDWFN